MAITRCFFSHDCHHRLRPDLRLVSDYQLELSAHNLFYHRSALLWFILGHWVSNKLHPHPVSPAASSRHHPYPATYHTLPCQVDTFTWGRSQNSAEHKIRHLFSAQMPKFCNRSGLYPFLGVGFNLFSH